MEGVLGALVFLAIAACCGLPILLLGAARLFNGNKNLQGEIPSAQQDHGQAIRIDPRWIGGKSGGRGWTG